MVHFIPNTIKNPQPSITVFDIILHYRAHEIVHIIIGRWKGMAIGTVHASRVSVR